MRFFSITFLLLLAQIAIAQTSAITDFRFKPENTGWTEDLIGVVDDDAKTTCEKDYHQFI